MTSERTVGFDIVGYARAINSNEPTRVAQWLFANAQTMSEGMFLDPANDWGGLDPEHLLALRSCAPARVFTEVAQEGFLSSVENDTELRDLAPALFASDFEMITRLPEAQQYLRQGITVLMNLAYEHDIRLADSRVLALE